MPKELIDTKHLLRPGGAYSSCLRAGDFIFVAGTLATDAQGNRVVRPSRANDTGPGKHSSYPAAAGASLNDCVKATVFLSDFSLFGQYNQVYSQY